jgi:hypothetical protein
LDEVAGEAGGELARGARAERRRGAEAPPRAERGARARAERRRGAEAPPRAERGARARGGRGVGVAALVIILFLPTLIPRPGLSNLQQQVANERNTRKKGKEQIQSNASRPLDITAGFLLFSRGLLPFYFIHRALRS